LTLYFFHYRHPEHYYRDSEGTDLVDLAAAGALARVSAGELLGLERAESDPYLLMGRYEIADGDGIVLAVVPFDEGAPA
jgi:hypothetical protein